MRIPIRALAVLLHVGAATTAYSQATGDRPTSFAFVDVTVIPMTAGGAIQRQTVLVDGGRITAIGPVASVRVPAGATTIDGRGKFLMPGLGDAHAHLSMAGAGPNLAERALTLFALHGVTMIRSAYTEPHHRDVVSRVERGEIIGPRTVMVSPAFHGQSAPNPQVARDSLRSYHRQGYRTTKILPGLSRETFDTLVAESKASGMKIAGHVPQGISLQHALASYTSLEHLDGYLEAMHATPGAQGGFFGMGLLGGLDTTRLPELVRLTRQAGTVVVPTEFEMELFVTTESGAMHARRPEMRYVAPAVVAAWTRQKDNFARGAGVTPDIATRYAGIRRSVIRRLHEAGVPIALGSDAFDLFSVPGPGVFDELAVYVEAGLSSQAALATATTTVAKLLDLPGVTGTVAVGSAADLVLLEANPLQDIANVRRQAGVMLGGRWFDHADLSKRLEEMVVR
jgi:hypothetical protein